MIEAFNTSVFPDLLGNADYVIGKILPIIRIELHLSILLEVAPSDEL